MGEYLLSSKCLTLSVSLTTYKVHWRDQEVGMDIIRKYWDSTERTEKLWSLVVNIDGKFISIGTHHSMYSR